jgi:hypothetical protein
MPGWFERWEQRRRELAEGADADLVRANRRRFRIGFGLVGLAVLLRLLSARLHPAPLLVTALRIASGISGVAGIVVAKWAQSEHHFLTRPDPEGPPEIFKDKP